MRPPSDARQRAGPAFFAVLLAALLATLALCVAPPAEAAGASVAAALPDLPDDEALDDAIYLQRRGDPWAAEAVLRRLAQSGHVVAMERLALMHWYGPALYPGQPWSREVARRWFATAALHGSELGRHMVKR